MASAIIDLAQRTPARCLLIVGAKGGCGASTLALALAQRLGSPATLVDADLGGARSAAFTLDIVDELTGRPGESAVARVDRLTILELTRRYEDGFLLNPEAVEDALRSLPPGPVVVDAPQPFAAAVRPFVRNAARFVIVVEPTLLGVRAGQQLAAAALRFGVPAARLCAVILARSADVQLTRGDIAGALPMPVVGDLPHTGDRGHERALAALLDVLRKIPPLAAIEEMRPSARSPIGDRRSARVIALPRDAERRTDVLPAAPTQLDAVKSDVHAALLARIDFSAAARAHSDTRKMAELQAQVEVIASELIAARSEITSAEDAARVKREIIEEALGLGPIETLLSDPEITEIMVNGARNIFIERGGRIESTAKRFVDEAQLRLVIERILAPLGRRIDESSPMVDARLPDGSRVNAIVEPLSIDGPALTIRRFGTRRLSIDDLIARSAVNDSIVAFLRACVAARLNVVVSGGTGSGKTTMLGALSAFIPRDERIVTIEDAAELALDQPHVVRLEARPANLEGRGAITIRDLVRNALRMRPDRIVIGECRGAEAFDMLQAMNTGHDGSLTTIHANSPRDALSRIETMVLMAGFDLPVRAIREQVASAVQIVAQVARLTDGTRKIVSVCEVAGMEGEIVTMQEVFRFDERGLDASGAVLGAFEATQVQPISLQRFSAKGIAYDDAPPAAVRRARR